MKNSNMRPRQTESEDHLRGALLQ